MTWLVAVAADLLALIHGLAVLFLVVIPIVSLFARRRIRWLDLAYLAVVGLTAISFLATGDCILTTWERLLRLRLVPQAAYPEGFVSHYLMRAGIRWSDRATLPLAIVLTALGVTGILLRWWQDRVDTAR